MMHRQTDREGRTSLQWLKLKLLGTTVLVVEHWSEDYPSPSESRRLVTKYSRPPGRDNPRTTDGQRTDGKEDESDWDDHSRSETEMCNGELWSLGNQVFLSPLTHPLHQPSQPTTVICEGEKLCYHKATEEGQNHRTTRPTSGIT